MDFSIKIVQTITRLVKAFTAIFLNKKNAESSKITCGKIESCEFKAVPRI